MKANEKNEEGTYVDNVPHQESENNLKAQAKKGDLWKEVLVFLKAKDYIQKLKEKKTQSGSIPIVI